MVSRLSVERAVIMYMAYRRNTGIAPTNSKKSSVLRLRPPAFSIPTHLPNLLLTLLFLLWVFRQTERLLSF